MTNSRRKGKDGELEACKLLRQLGFPAARRMQQYCGKEGHADVAGVPGLHLEVKRMRRVRIQNHLLGQAVDECKDGDLPCLLSREDGSEWVFSCRLVDLPAVAEVVVRERVLECK